MAIEIAEETKTDFMQMLLALDFSTTGPCSVPHGDHRS